MTAIPLFPRMNLGRESVALFPCANGHYPEKEFPQAFGVGSLGAPPAPRESLALNMYQAALQNNTGPEAAEQPVQMGVAVHCGALRRKPAAGEVGAKLPQASRPFGYPVGCVHQFVAPRLHRCEDSLASRKAGSIQNEMPISGKIHFRRGRMLQPIANNPANGRYAVTALIRYLPQRIPLPYPALKPDPLPKQLGADVLPPKCPVTITTKPSLSTMTAPPVADDFKGTTPPTTLFSFIITLGFLNRFKNIIHNPFTKNNFQKIYQYLLNIMPIPSEAKNLGRGAIPNHPTRMFRFAQHDKVRIFVNA